MTDVATEPTMGTGTQRSETGGGWQKAGDVAALPERPASAEPTPVAPKDSYDPRKHVRELRGRGGASEYLDVKHRIVWFGKEHPDGQIIPEVIQVTDKFAFFKATVSWVDAQGRLVACVAHGSETLSDFGDYIEKAETKAVGRALQHARYGTASMPDDDALADSPVAHNSGPVRDERADAVAKPASAPSNAPQAANRERTERAAMGGEITAQMKRTGATPEDVRDYCDELFGVTDARKLSSDQMRDLLKEFRGIPNDRFAELRKETTNA